MAQPEVPSCSEIQTYGLHGRDQTRCIEDTTQLDDSSRSRLKSEEIEEVCDGGQTHRNSSAKSWLIQIKKKLNSPDKMWQVSEKVCIYRVPKSILISNPQAYVPFVVALGPYHHKVSSELSRMDENKLEAIIRMSMRLRININTLTEEVKNLESEVREFYAEPIDLDGEALSWMLTMDACFILEFFKRRRFIFEILGKGNSTHIAIMDDIIKLENQIPLFILIKLLQQEFFIGEEAIRRLAAIIHSHAVFRGHPFQLSWKDDCIHKLQNHMTKERPPQHLLDLYRMVIVDLLTNSSVNSATPVESDSNGSDGNINSYQGRRCGQLMNVALTALMQRLRFFNCSDGNINSYQDRTRSAELLHKAGVTFKPGNFRFEKKKLRAGTLFIPEISVEVRTEGLLRNLMACEECRLGSQPPEENIISQYVRVLYNLIDSEKDVSILRKSLIIQSYVGSDEEIARMFNRLGDGITFGKGDVFDKVMQQARGHCMSRWTVWISDLIKQWISEFKQRYCSKPWHAISLMAAILILVMTAVQTVFSVKK